MKWKWLALGCGFLTVSLIVTSCESIRTSFGSYSFIKKLPGAETIETATQQISLQKIKLEPYAQTIDGTLTSPKYNNFSAEGTVQVSGTVGKYEDLGSEFAWIQIDYTGKQQAGLPSSFHYYVPIKQGHFREKIQLFAGKGEYKVTIRMPGASEEEYYYPFASFRVTNENPSVRRDISYSTSAKKAGLVISSPLTGYTVQRKSVALSGRLAEETQAKKVLLQLRKGEKVWKRVIPVKDHQFAESIPLLYGKGVHELQVMVPDEKRSGYYVEGAALYVDNTSSEERTPVEYTGLYHERGVHLTRPIAGGDRAELTYRIAGTIDPDAKFSKETDYMIVQTTKGENKATYFIPVNQYRFDSEIWLRFGAGTYQITVYVPEVTTEQRDYFRFYTVASFQVKSKASSDLRDLLPSRGVQSDHPDIRDLAREITAGKKTNREKAKAIYQYVANVMEYDVEKLRNNSFEWDDSALKSLQKKSGVCQDFAFLSIALLRSLDIPARFVEGESAGQRHAWVEVWTGERWLTMDPTWGAGYITPEGSFVKKYDEKFFDPSPEAFAKTHKRTGVVY
ncbi:transglutaminase family protein [Paenactinomyces guangxiensis]|uniref:Transglutaminase domain-containing protein n=1 Tax=Paenactinomyces guangxiensis TaxID=1490290 RepID=A0A7W1WRM0_9BACL|nr:transglutaminase-like domain-containing protein [Paenactinomyces guangxiensis]MBA4494800.1 transglutaminase domain-containing protein [Paenactinomyces guangxiensis]MBH8591883.1 transglutaminase domain-containing protein [Paenactinomyces guangxiensis]